MRIVSLDFCADQYVLKLADREQILAVSPDAVKDFSYMRDAAQDVPSVRPIAEDVLILKPDLVVRSYGGGPNAARFFERAGVPVLQVGWTSSVHGAGPNTIPKITRDVATGLGQSARGEALIEAFQSRLAKIKSAASGKSTLYITPAGVTTGGNSLAHEMLLAAGLTNYSDAKGWHSLPLEQLAYERPDLVAAAYFNAKTNHGEAWSASRHPVAKRELTENQRIDLDGAWLSCGGWFLIEAIEALAAGAKSVD
ncbi:MAG: ABC transporter substrate-binding protein [Pseudomonadota bacterium]